MKHRSYLSLPLPVVRDSTHVEAQDNSVAREGLWLLIGKDLLIPHFGSGVFARVLALSFLKGLGAADHSHDPGVQMALVEPLWMVSEGKGKLA
jgi:hypothetical protein